MKALIITSAIFLMAVLSYAQDVTEIKSNTDEIVVTQPEFYGTVNYLDIVHGNKVESLDSYLLRNVKFPAPNETRTFPEGTELIRFEVTKDGKLENFQVINSISRAIDQEMIRVLKTTEGMWVPGKNDETPQTMEKEVEMAFKISGEKDRAMQKDFNRIARGYFVKGSKALFEKENPKKALVYIDKGVNYLPRECNLLFMKGLCHLELGQAEEAGEVWNRIQKNSCLYDAFSVNYAELALQLDKIGVDQSLLKYVNASQDSKK